MKEDTVCMHLAEHLTWEVGSKYFLLLLLFSSPYPKHNLNPNPTPKTKAHPNPYAKPKLMLVLIQKIFSNQCQKVICKPPISTSLDITKNTNSESLSTPSVSRSLGLKPRNLHFSQELQVMFMYIENLKTLLKDLNFVF